MNNVKFTGCVIVTFDTDKPSNDIAILNKVKDKTFKQTVVTAKDKYNKYKPIFKCMLDIQNIHATDKHAFIINCLAQCKKHMETLGIKNTGVTERIFHVYSLVNIDDNEIEQIMKFMSDLCEL